METATLEDYEDFIQEPWMVNIEKMNKEPLGVMSVLKEKKACGLVLLKQYRVSQPQPHALLTPDHFQVSQPLPQRMPVKDVNKGMKINRSTVYVAYTVYRNFHIPSTV